jgi:hypothetical protein
MERKVPFLLNASPAGTDRPFDRILWRCAAHFRRKRFAVLAPLITGVHSIIDFGGRPSIWTSMGRDNVVLLNIDEQPVPPGFIALRGDACHTEFPDQSFDLAFSNSVIEHVGTWEDQQAFASELCRVGKAVFCQTPARSFFFEPHYFTPFVHWFPFLLKHYWFVRHFTWYGVKWKPAREQVMDFQSHLRLLTHSEMRILFPNCVIRRERFLGMTKAYLAQSA